MNKNVIRIAGAVLLVTLAVDWARLRWEQSNLHAEAERAVALAELHSQISEACISTLRASKLTYAVKMSVPDGGDL